MPIVMFLTFAGRSFKVYSFLRVFGLKTTSTKALLQPSALVGALLKASALVAFRPEAGKTVLKKNIFFRLLILINLEFGQYCNCNYILFNKLPWPGDSKGTYLSSNRASTCPLVYRTRRKLHIVPLIAEGQAGKL